MNWDQIEGKWTQLKGNVREKWGKLTADDVDAIAGSREQFIDKLQEKYRLARIPTWQFLKPAFRKREGHMKPARVLLVGSGAATQSLQELLSASALPRLVTATPFELPERLRHGDFDAIVFCPDGTPKPDGQVLTALRRDVADTPIVVVAARTADLAEWSAAGAFDCLTQPVDRGALTAALQRAFTWRHLRDTNDHALGPPPHRRSAPPFPQLVGDSEAMQAVYRWVQKVAPSEANVCVYGESGTGKELVARALHESGRRRGRTFVVLDCAAIPEGLMESEMFGHVRGAFTSAVGDRVGVFQLADTGTLFLDEVAELPLPLQGKLLRLIQNREVRRVGSNQRIRVDVRIIAATNQDLAALVTQGRFREDLFYRLDVISVTLPPLRERKEDIPLLVDHFLAQFNRQSNRQIRGVTARTLQLLLKYDWPGNVRELQNCIERAAVMADGDLLDVTELREVLYPGRRWSVETRGRLKAVERELILQALKQTRGNKRVAAALLGISLRGLYYKLKWLGPEATPEDV